MYPASTNETLGTNVSFHCTADSENSRKYGVEWEFIRNGSHDPVTICSGTDPPLLQWRGKYDCKSVGNQHILLIHHVSFSDSGKYVCIEDGGRGPHKGYSELLVFRKCALSLQIFYRATLC